MPRLLHMADVHLGARHRDLGDAAERQRERQLAAFRAAVEVALERRVDVVLICGDLFDSNSQHRRTVEQAAAALGRLAAAGVRSVLIPGTHDVYDPSSIYRAFDLRAMAGQPATSDLVTVLAAPPAPTDVVFRDLDLVVYGRVFPTKRAPRSPLDGFSADTEARARWRVGMIHGSVHIPGVVETDEVIVEPDEIAASGLDYLALGHWHSTYQGTAGRVPWAFSGAPEPVAVDQDGAGGVLLVTLDESGGERRVTTERIAVSRTSHRTLDVDAAGIASEEALVTRLAAAADPDQMLDVQLVGIRPETLSVDPVKVAAALAPSYLRVRVRDRSTPAPLGGALPPADTIMGRFVRDLEERITAAAAAGREQDAADAREVLLLGRLLLDRPDSVTLA